MARPRKKIAVEKPQVANSRKLGEHNATCIVHQPGGGTAYFRKLEYGFEFSVDGVLAIEEELCQQIMSAGQVPAHDIVPTDDFDDDFDDDD